MIAGKPRRQVITIVLALAALVGLGGLFAVRHSIGRAPSLSASLPAPVSDRIWSIPTAAGRPIVVIDAGHGGADPGARAVSGELVEKDLTLAFARELRDLLVERGRVRVAMTRDTDVYLPLDSRSAVADRLDKLNVEYRPNTPEDFRAFVASELERWGRVVKEANIKLG